MRKGEKPPRHASQTKVVSGDDYAGESRSMSAADKVALHMSGRCIPCLYYTRKDDGCRKGDACSHCHFCTAPQARTRRNRLQHEARKARRSGVKNVVENEVERILFEL
mmetsp:Transcript_1678/g.4254  ORF Transcript_1678/g.4254 Transcript_1678/m.4254 type:complete len:108 (+) Transcript_1678:2-325(+)